jgi:hypothetical protein
VLRDQRRGAHREQQEPDHAHREQLRAHQLQLRADAAELAEGERAAHLPHDSGRRAAQPQELWRPQLGDGAGLQPHHYAAGQPRDRITQIRWGIADYEHHYGAPPEGMWLAETAADTESLELLAQHGIKFTVLAPHQCKRIAAAAKGMRRWTDTPAQRGYDAPYLVRFDSGVSIAVFFYNGPMSRAIAFEGLLNSGRELCRAAQGGIQRQRSRNWCTWPPMANRTATITSTARWRWPMRCACWNGQDGEADQLWQLSGAVSAGVRSRDCGEHLVELRARRGTLALQLRLQRRQAGLQPALARAAAQALDELRDA